MVNEKEIKHRVEVMGDYDGILYHIYEDWTKKNIHCNIEFDEEKQREEYMPLYQFKDWKLVAYSRYKAEWLTIDDDINKWENLLWWSRGIYWTQEMIFKPIKDLSIAHIKTILETKQTNNKQYIKAFQNILDSIITIKWADYQNDT